MNKILYQSINQPINLANNTMIIPSMHSPLLHHVYDVGSIPSTEDEQMLISFIYNLLKGKRTLAYLIDEMAMCGYIGENLLYAGPWRWEEDQSGRDENQLEG